jgi:hypothetical protein
MISAKTDYKIYSRPFKNAHTNRDSDRELIKLSAYLKMISVLPNFQGSIL